MTLLMQFTVYPNTPQEIMINTIAANFSFTEIGPISPYPTVPLVF